ncbi:MAG: hypothetical protein ACYC7D_12890 [Nitrososphaerales archaeon]
MKNLKKGIKLSKIRIILLFLAILALVLTIALRGEVAPQSVQVVDGEKYLNPIYGETQYATVGYSDNFQNWSASYGTLQASSSGLTLSGTLPPANNISEVLLSKQINVNITQFPLAYFSIMATPGVEFGMLFKARASNGSIIQLNANSELNLNHGLGYFQNFQSNLLLGESALGNITNAYVYLERGPNSSATTFSLQMRSFQFFKYPIASLNSSSGAYHAAFLTFNLNVQNSSWKLDHVNLGASINATPGTTFDIFLVEGQSVYDAGSYDYSQSIASYEYTLVPQSDTGYFPDSLPKGNFSIAIVTTSGYLENVQVGYVSFISLPASHPSITIPPQYYREIYTYVVFFLFLLPLLVAVLVYDKFRSGSFNGSHVRLALIVGVVSRLALAPVTGHPYDTLIFASSDRSWFEFGVSNSSLGPTLPLTFFLYRIPYSFYALLELARFHDAYFAQSQVGMIESIFVKAFPMISDFAVFYLLKIMDKAGKVGTLFGLFYLLNPLTIYVSAVWGQYEAAASALIILGFYLLINTKNKELIAGVALALSSLVELFALIPLGFLILRSFFSKPFRIRTPIFLALPLILFLVYEPEFHLVYLVLLSAFGAVPALGFSTTNAYSLISNFPAIAYYHPLLSSLFLIVVGFIVYGRHDIETVLIFTAGAFLAIILFGAQLVQWWALLPPLGLLTALTTKKYALGIYTLTFGSIIAFVSLSYTQRSGYMILGNQSISLMPVVEQTRNNLLLYTLTTTIASFLFVMYMVRKGSSGDHTLRNSSLILIGTFITEFILFGVLGL